MKQTKLGPAAAHFESIARSRDPNYPNVLLDHIPPSTKRLLDAGCASGRLTLEFAGCAEFAVGLDLVPELTDLARLIQAEKKIGNVAWVVGDVEHPPFVSNCFDVVVSTNALRLTDLPVSLSRLTDLIRPGGRTAIQDLIDTTGGLGPIPLSYLFRTLRSIPKYLRFYGPPTALRIIAHRLKPVELARAARVRRTTYAALTQIYDRIMPGSRLSKTERGYLNVWDKP
jgi:SAM-dependent methyltransferase